MDKRILKENFTHYIGLTNEIISGEIKTCLSATKISHNENKYFFSLKKPVIDLKFSNDYKTGLIVNFENSGSITTCYIKKQTPGYVPVLAIITIFFFLFNTFLLPGSSSTFSVPFLVVLLIVIIILHSFNLDKIKNEFDLLYAE